MTIVAPAKSQNKQAGKGLKSNDNKPFILEFTILPKRVCSLNPPIRHRNQADAEGLLRPGEFIVAATLCSMVRLTYRHDQQNEAWDAGAAAMKKATAERNMKGKQLHIKSAKAIGSAARSNYLMRTEGSLPKVFKFQTSYRAIMRAIGISESGKNAKRIIAALNRLTEPVSLPDGGEMPPLIRKWYIDKGALWLHINTREWVPMKRDFCRVKWPLPNTAAALKLYLIASGLNDLSGTYVGGDGMKRSKLMKAVSTSGRWNKVKSARDTLAEKNGFKLKFRRRGKYVKLLLRKQKTEA